MNLTEHFSTLRRILLIGELGAAQLLLLFTIVIVPYYNTQWTGAGWIGSALLLLSGCLLAFFLTRSFGETFRKKIATVIAHFGLPKIIGLGVLAQICVSLLTEPVLVSDPRTYLALAQKLAGGLDYADEVGHRAFWPPGLPFYLVPFVLFFGAGALTVTVANIILYVIGTIATWDLGRRIFDNQVGIFAAFLFTIWPSRLLCAGLASKENLTVAMIVSGSTFCIAAFESMGRKSWFFAAGAGLSFGLAALTQPGLLLLVAAIPLIYRKEFLCRPGQFVARSAVVIVFAVISLLPWHIRNCMVFDSQFCGIATNGGSVFYRANNPKATGLWIEEGDVPISHLPELTQNQIGFELGKQWIRDNPHEFLKLALKKLTHFVGDDKYGASFGILRGKGLDYEQAMRTSSPERLWSYRTAAWISLAFWVMVVAWSARAIGFSAWKNHFPKSERLLPLVYPLLYSAAVFSVFESGSRQHIVAEGVLLVLAASYLVEPDRNRRQD